MGKRGPKPKDYTGIRFGNLTVIEMTRLPNRKSRYAKCKCDCGNIVTVDVQYLRNGHTTSCGSCAYRNDERIAKKLTRIAALHEQWMKDNGKMPDYHNLVGYRFGRLVVEKDMGVKSLSAHSNRSRVVLCRCDCGNEKEIYVHLLLKGNTRSCGCLRKDIGTTRNYDGHTLKGSPDARLYRIWALMKERCTDEHYHHYSDYGGRGIKVCPEWMNWRPFAEWAHANGYRDNLTIERIDVNDDYYPENCTWIPKSEQPKNTRKTMLITYQGEQLPAVEWAKKTGIPYETIRRRFQLGLKTREVLREYVEAQEGEHAQEAARSDRTEVRALDSARHDA